MQAPDLDDLIKSPAERTAYEAGYHQALRDLRQFWFDDDQLGVPEPVPTRFDARVGGRSIQRTRGASRSRARLPGARL